MAEISSPDYPGERLLVCKNPLLAEERQRKRDALLALTETELSKIQARMTRTKTQLRGAGEIGRAVGAVLGKRKMAKHFDLTITDDAFGFARKIDAIAEEARFDGFYVCAPASRPSRPTPPRRYVTTRILHRWSARSAASRRSIWRH